VLSGEVVADIFLGNITEWSDPAITELNPDVEIPDLPITVAHRSDGSGTTSIFVDYLGKVSEQWASEVSTGPQTSVQWPTGIGGDGNAGVTNIVAQTPGAIGYVGLEYAVENNVAYTNMINASGETVEPTLEAVAAAADTELPDDLRATFTDSDNPAAWPIAGFTWVVMYEDQNYGERTQEQAQQTLDLVRWMITEGQQYNNELNYGQLADSTQERALELLDGVTYGGEPLTGN
jgi:phosphate transport system substrate-binding protein